MNLNPLGNLISFIILYNGGNCNNHAITYNVLIEKLVYVSKSS